MGKPIIAALLIVSLTTVASATPPRKGSAKRPTTSRTEPVACGALHDEYELASKRLALNWAQGATDNSAARATMRSTQDSMTVDQARTTIELLRGNGCKAPTGAPDKEPYMAQALECNTAFLRAQIAMVGGRGDSGPIPGCDMTQWKRN